MHLLASVKTLRPSREDKVQYGKKLIDPSISELSVPVWALSSELLLVFDLQLFLGNLGSLMPSVDLLTTRDWRFFCSLAVIAGGMITICVTLT